MKKIKLNLKNFFKHSVMQVMLASMFIPAVMTGCQMQAVDFDETQSVVSNDDVDKKAKSWEYKENIGAGYDKYLLSLTSNKTLQGFMKIPLSVANGLLDDYTFGLGSTVLSILLPDDEEGPDITAETYKKVGEIAENVDKMRAEMNAQFAQLNGLVSQSASDLENMITEYVDDAELKAYLKNRQMSESRIKNLLGFYFLSVGDPSDYSYHQHLAEEFFGQTFLSKENQNTDIKKVVTEFFNPINGDTNIPKIWRNYYEKKQLFRWASNECVRAQMNIEYKYALTARILADAALNPNYPNVKTYYAQKEVFKNGETIDKKLYGCTFGDFLDAVNFNKSSAQWNEFRRNFTFRDKNGKALKAVAKYNGYPSMVNPNEFKSTETYESYCLIEDNYIFQEFKNQLIEKFLENYPALKNIMQNGLNHSLVPAYKDTMDCLDGFINAINDSLVNLPREEAGYLTLNFVSNDHKVYYRRVMTNILNDNIVVDTPMDHKYFDHYHQESPNINNARTLIEGVLDFTGKSGVQELPYWFSACLLNSNHFLINAGTGYPNNNCNGTVRVQKAEAAPLSSEEQLSILKGNLVNDDISACPDYAGALYFFKTKAGVKSISDVNKGKSVANLFTKSEMEQIISYFGTMGYAKLTAEKDGKYVTYKMAEGEKKYSTNIKDILTEGFGINVPVYRHKFWDGANRGTEFFKQSPGQYITVNSPVEYKDIKIFVPVTGDASTKIGPNTFNIHGVKQNDLKLNVNADGQVTNLDKFFETSSNYEEMMKIAFVTPVIHDWDGNKWVSAKDHEGYWTLNKK